MSSKTKRIGTLAQIYQAKNLDGSITSIRLNRIQPSEVQPRQDRKNGIENLAESLKTDGLISPIVVVKNGESYRIIAGERRFHAASLLGWENIECKIVSRKESELWRISIIENLQRENLSPEEEASALQQLKQKENLSDAQLGKMVGKSRNYITEILSINILPKETLDLCRENGIVQHNMLIQAVQAFKNNSLNEFINEYKNGLIDTVRKAKEFNRSKKENSERPSNENKKNNTDFTMFGYSITIKKNQILINCPDTLHLNELLESIKDYIKK